MTYISAVGGGVGSHRWFDLVPEDGHLRAADRGRGGMLPVGTARAD